MDGSGPDGESEAPPEAGRWIKQCQVEAAFQAPSRADIPLAEFTKHHTRDAHLTSFLEP